MKKQLHSKVKTRIIMSTVTGNFHYSSLGVDVIANLTFEEFISKMETEATEAKVPVEIFSTKFKVPNNTIKFVYEHCDFQKKIVIEKEKISLGKLLYLHPKTHLNAFSADETEDEPDYIYNGRFEIKFTSQMLIVSFGTDT